jgi:hypothetical protein
MFYLGIGAGLGMVSSGVQEVAAQRGIETDTGIGRGRGRMQSGGRGCRIEREISIGGES